MAETASRKVLVIEDEIGIRNNILLMLKLEGYSAIGAENGRVGLDLARANPPDLILCDVNMPEMNGFAVLEALRADEALADIPFVFLTALGDRPSMRHGMNLGADDYLTKPFTREELLETVGSRLKKHEAAARALVSRLVPPQDELTRKFREQISGEAAILPPTPSEAVNLTGKITQATVLFSDIRNFTTYSERLTSGEIAELLNAYLQRACEPIVASGGRVLQFLGDGLMALFEDGASAHPEPHAERALRAGLAMQLAAHRFRNWVGAHYPKRGLPEFAVGVGVHSGEVLLGHIGGPGHAELTVIGDTVNIASRLESLTKELGWAVVASEATIASCSDRVRVGARKSLQLRGRSGETEVFEVLGVESVEPTGAPVALDEDLRQALAASARVAAGAAKEALGITLRLITAELTGGQADRPITLRGYRVLSRIGRGGSSLVYLAERAEDGQKVVLKILHAARNKDESQLARFMREFDIISSIDHPNVVKIYDRGFTEESAYIAMEYFPGGTLGELIARGLTERQALSLLAQAAAALREIHSRGIIHRDIKPANLMARDDGSIALVDFGIAKRLDDDSGRTRQGELYGTPYYVSPEQIDGQPATPRSDLYALGIIFHEMLTRRRPFQADTVSEVIALHRGAPRPRLPESLAEYQEILDRLLAVDPRDRYPSADELLEAIDRVWTRQALRAMRGS